MEFSGKISIEFSDKKGCLMILDSDVSAGMTDCIFPGRYAPYYEDVLEASRNTLMARNAREICNFFSHLYLHNGSSKN